MSIDDRSDGEASAGLPQHRGSDARFDHLPFPIPDRPHSVIQHWRHLTFLHWQADPQQIRRYLPDGLELDLYQDKAYVGLLPFQMKHVRPRGMLPIPGICYFPEFNLRTYVQYQGQGGILFLTLEAQSRIACWYGHRSYGLPYQYARGRVQVEGDQYRWQTRRVSDGLELIGSCQAFGESMQAQPGSLEQFLFERYRLYTLHDRQLKMVRAAHDPWKFRIAEATIVSNTLLDSYDLGIADVRQPDLVHASDGVKALTWSLEPVAQ
ncbi:MAG: hypothetical protein DSY81_08850 [Bacillota bacterium]|nr:MAG: hypothetical protein DSY81_08850 [Bacillota bacterium]